MSSVAYDTARRALDANTYRDETALIEELRIASGLDAETRQTIAALGADLVRKIRARSDPGLMEVFLAEYGLSTDEGVALMCLAEALLRVPDAETIDALIEDKIAPSDWGRHMGRSTSPLVNASTWALLLTGKVLADEQPGLVGTLKSAVRRLGEPVIRAAVGRAMKEMGRQFVLGESIDSAMKRAQKRESEGYTYSYDMLGEAARTDADAQRYFDAYMRAIKAIGRAATHDNIRDNPGISVKLSALHARYEVAQSTRVMEELVPRLAALCAEAKHMGIGLNIDAEEADRLAISFDVMEAVLADDGLTGWDGFGIVVQAYGRRAGDAIDAIYALAQKYDRRIMVRLVKGAYWDTEIKLAQVEGMKSFPVFTDKAATDISYLANARKLLGMTDRLYPQFATHNAHSVAAILTMAEDHRAFEFQRLHGMGEALHEIVHGDHGTRCRIYAPVGAHEDLLAYLVRRLLENGANSSFVNRIVDENVPPEEVAPDPFDAYEARARHIQTSPELFEKRKNSAGYDLTDAVSLEAIDAARSPFLTATWDVAPRLANKAAPEAPRPVTNPADPSDQVGSVAYASAADIESALDAARVWDVPAEERARVLIRASELYEEHYGRFFALAAREAGKIMADCAAEVREAVDFLRYYAANAPETAPVGVFTCISPWNFPLAIFTGQIAAALAAGNGVLAKPAEQTPIIADFAVSLLHEAGVPREVLQLLPGAGEVGAALTSDRRVGGVAFTGGTDTALKIRSAMAAHLAPGAPLVAETGGMNAMIVDSTALPEQAVRDVIESAFKSAGQRCSALRCLYMQKDVADKVTTMLKGAMEELRIGAPWDLSTDVGPLIDSEALENIGGYIEEKADRILHQLPLPESPKGASFVAPTLLSVKGIAEMEREVFGPVLHLATFEADELDAVIDTINATGYGLTFGLQTRIDDRVQEVTEKVDAGNIYVNRNQIGAIVGSQPFGGHGLSGTGPKAGGPLYLGRFGAHTAPRAGTAWDSEDSAEALQARITSTAVVLAPETETLPGPTGESNQLHSYSRIPVLCLGPDAETAAAQAEAVRALGGTPVEAAGSLAPTALETLTDFCAALWWGDEETARALVAALARRPGAIVPLVTGLPDRGHVRLEKVVCIDTTASGGNAELLGGGA